ncbi:MAG: UvrD-helicase domain-containing protein [Panacagrimonas sp.]
MSSQPHSEPTSLLSGLTKSQHAAATSSAAHSLVLAGPGSGKTSTIVARGQHLLSATPDYGIAVVTFTRASANEVHDRLLRGGADKNRCVVGTFHNLSLRLLRLSGLSIPSSDILVPAEQDRFLRDAMATCNWRSTVTEARATLELSGARKSNVFKPHQVALLAAYANRLQTLKKFDFADLIKRVVLDKSVMPLPAHHLLIDEAQDIDEWQLEWVLHQAASGLNTTMVADDDQSIYGFRHALGVHGLHRYTDALKPVRQFVLEDNFRSGPKIVEVAQALIRHDQQRIDKNVCCQAHVDGEVTVYSAHTPEDELLRAALATKDSPGEWAVLARTNNELAHMAISLSQRGIPYWIDSDSDIWQSGLGAALLALLRSLLVPEPTAELQRAMIDLRINAAGDPPAFTSDPVYGNHVWPTWVESQTLNLSREQKIALLELPRRWSAWFNNHRDATKSVVEDIAKWVEPFVGNREERLFSALATCLEKRRGGIANRILCRKLRADKPQGVVTLSTMHSAKGLEFDRVWICGLDARIDDDADCDVAEERRLHYVGFTRAKVQLVMSYEKAHGPSRYLRESGVAPRPSTRNARRSRYR